MTNIFTENNLIQFVESLFVAIRGNKIKLERITDARFETAWLLRKKYQDKPRISFTDLTSMVVMAEVGITHILTQDDHFAQVGMGFQKIP